MNELRLIRRAAQSLVVLALLAAALALHALYAERDAEPPVPRLAPHGLVLTITGIKRGGAADRAGLRIGDVVERIDGHAPGSIIDAEQAMASGRHTDVFIRRNEHIIDVVLQ